MPAISEYTLKTDYDACGVLQTADASGCRTIGRVDDDNAIKLTFTWPDDLAVYTAACVLSADDKSLVVPITEKSVMLTAQHTQYNMLAVTPVFTGPDFQKTGGTWVYTLDDIPDALEPIPTPWPSPVTDAFIGVATAVSGDTVTLTFTNSLGAVVGTSQFTASGGGGSSTVAWLPDVSEAGVISFTRSDTETAPTPRNITGPPGADGLTTSVNGVEQADGNIALGAADIPIADTGGHFTAPDVEGALSELFTSVSDGKAALATGIEDKGGTVEAAGDVPTFAELDAGILSIPGHTNWMKNTAASVSASGVSKTVYADGSYSMTGTSTAYHGFYIAGNSGSNTPIITIPPNTNFAILPNQFDSSSAGLGSVFARIVRADTFAEVDDAAYGLKSYPYAVGVTNMRHVIWAGQTFSGQSFHPGIVPVVWVPFG